MHSKFRVFPFKKFFVSFKMQKITFFILILVSLFCIFAYTMESVDQPNIYTESIPINKDSINVLYKKLTNCLSIHKSSIKWRRSFLAAVICMILIFSLVYFRIPEPKEIILYIMVIYAVYYITWENFNRTVADKAESIGHDIINRLQNGNYKKRTRKTSITT
jgi:hypothetical protein